MKAFLHARIHAKKYGGVPEDYIDIDSFIDSSKTAPATARFCILHLGALKLSKSLATTFKSP